MSDIRERKSVPGLRAFAPYILVEVLLPGGTLVALLLWLWQRFSRTGFGGVNRVAGQTRKAVVAAAPHANPAPAADR